MQRESDLFKRFKKYGAHLVFENQKRIQSILDELELNPINTWSARNNYNVWILGNQCYLEKTNGYKPKQNV